MEPTTALPDAIAAYIARIAERGRGTAAFPRTRSHQTYRYALQSFELFLAEARPAATTIADLAATDLADYTRWLARRYRGTTVQLYTTALKGFLQFLTRRRVLPFDLDEALALFEDERPRFRYPTPEVVDGAPAVLERHAGERPPAAGSDAPRAARVRELGWLRDQALLQVLFSTGARISEVLALTRSDVKQGRATRVIVHGKGGKERPLPLPPDDRAAITAYLGARTDGSPYLFVSHAGRTPGAPLSRSYAWKLITRLARDTDAAGLSPHGIRRWLATMALRDGEDLKTISAALGHSSTAVTEQVYAFVSQEQVAERWGAAAARLRKRGPMGSAADLLEESGSEKV